MAQRAAPQAHPGGPGRYAERLGLSWWLWLPALALAALFAAEIYLGAPGVWTWVPYAIMLPATAAGLLALGRIRVAVTDDELRVDDARLPIRYVAGVTMLSPAEKRLLLGTAAHPHAFVIQRPWIGGAVQVHLDDPADPTPYWVVSSRHPATFAAAVLAARSAARKATEKGTAAAGG